MSAHEYRRASAAHSALLFMSGVPAVAYGDQVIIRQAQGPQRHGQVIRASEKLTLVQVFEGTDGLALEQTWVRFLDRPQALAVSPALLGRRFSGVGEPRDGRPPVLSREYRDVNSTPINPAARAFPHEFIQTGVSVIDGLNSVVRGQKLPIFSGAGLPHNRLAAQIVRQASLPEEASRFAVVFATMGISYDEARFFEDDLAESGVQGRVVMFTNLADDPSIERLLVPRMALTAAEYLAFDLDLHVLVVMTDMTRYAEALREVGTARGDVPTRKGYPGYLYSDLASLYERAGRIRDQAGSITLMPILSMPSDDITHPIPDLTGYITDGQIVLSRALNAQGAYPPVDVPPSLSRLMKDGIGEGRTREDHRRLATQLYTSYAQALTVRNLASIIGHEDLSKSDRQLLEFAEGFEQRFVSQGEHEERDIGRTLDIAWEVLSVLPDEQLGRLSTEDLQRHGRRTPTEEDTSEPTASPPDDSEDSESAEDSSKGAHHGQRA